MKKVSEHAQVAKLSKAYVKSLGLKCNVRSDIFSMGTSVDVTVYGATIEQEKMIQKELGKYQYGKFNGMEDIYEHTNEREDIPQVKYLCCYFR